MNQPWTVLRLLEWTTDYLRSHGSQSARLDAEVLLAKALDCRRIDLYTSYDKLASEDVKDRFRELVRRRAEGVPVAYLVGHREFYSRDFHVSPAVLIPRPESEFIVISLLDLARQFPDSRPLRIADVGTGSGNLAICAAVELPQARVVAIDISPEALHVARRNAGAHGVAERIEFLAGNLLEPIHPTAQFHFVLSNPPYVSRQELETLQPEVRQYEPQVALVAGERGVEVIERLIPQAAERLLPGGWLITEISPMIEKEVYRRLTEDQRFEAIATRRDVAQLPRVVTARRHGTGRDGT
jgi:release factor glutamine methyltransferase